MLIYMKIVGQQIAKLLLANDFKPMAKCLKYTLYASHIVLNTSYSITQESNGKMGEPHGHLFFVKIDEKSSLVCDLTAILGSVDKFSKCTTYAYGLKHVIKYHKGDKMSILAIHEEQKSIIF